MSSGGIDVIEESDLDFVITVGFGAGGLTSFTAGTAAAVAAGGGDGVAATSSTISGSGA